MMLMKWKWFASFLGGFAFLTVFLFNLRVNLIGTSFLRGIIAFFIFFFLGVFVHIILYFNLRYIEKKGTNIDLHSSDNGELDFNEIYNTSKDKDFKPLDFAKVNTSDFKNI